MSYCISAFWTLDYFYIIIKDGSRPRYFMVPTCVCLVLPQCLLAWWFPFFWNDVQPQLGRMIPNASDIHLPMNEKKHFSARINPLLIGGVEHGCCFSIQLGMSSSQLTFIFLRGVGQPPINWVYRSRTQCYQQLGSKGGGPSTTSNPKTWRVRRVDVPNSKDPTWISMNFRERFWQKLPPPFKTAGTRDSRGDVYISNQQVQTFFRSFRIPVTNQIKSPLNHH